MKSPLRPTKVIAQRWRGNVEYSVQFIPTPPWWIPSEKWYEEDGFLVYMTPYYSTYYTDVICRKLPQKKMGMKTIRKAKNRWCAQSCRSQKYLSDILRECPKVSIIGGKKPSVNDLIWGYDSYEEALRNSGQIYRERELWQSLSGEWHTAITLEQERAVCLMQSYTPHFWSCQRVNLDEVPRWQTKLIVKYLGLAAMFPFQHHYAFRKLQDLDWHKCARFFQLDNDGFILRRFTLFYGNGVSNFYNCSPQEVTINGVTYGRANPALWTGFGYLNHG